MADYFRVDYDSDFILNTCKTGIPHIYSLYCRYAIGHAERSGPKGHIGWLASLANATDQPYLANNTGGPTIKVKTFTPRLQLTRAQCETFFAGGGIRLVYQYCTITLRRGK